MIDNAAGSIIVGASTINALGDVGPGSLVLLTFRVKDDAPAGTATINLRHDLNGVTTALSEGYLVLQPVPSNAAGDELDGAIEVKREVRRLRSLTLPARLNSTLIHRSSFILHPFLRSLTLLARQKTCSTT